jgi:hypothetical protein
MATIPCPICNTEFDPRSDYNGYRQNGTDMRTRCSEACRDRALDSRGPLGKLKNCKWCETPFDPQRNLDGTLSRTIRHFDTEECREAHRKFKQKQRQNKRTGRG